MQLVQAEVLYQRGALPQATYLFKHALIQEAAYQSLLKSTRQQYHQRIAAGVEQPVSQTTAETQPEAAGAALHGSRPPRAGSPLLAAGGRQGHGRRSAYVEAIAHLTKGLEVLKTMPDTPERALHELDLATRSVVSLRVTKGLAAPEVEAV